MTQAVFGTSGTSMSMGTSGFGTNAPGSPPVESQRGSVAATLICLYARIAIRTPPAHRATSRNRMVELLTKARDPDQCIDELLNVCTNEGGAAGLDLAIDVLAETGTLVLQYSWEFLKRDISDWSPVSNHAYKPNDDYWYVLLRAVGRTDASKSERLLMLICCREAQSRGIREGVVEALRDVGTPTARMMLAGFANDSDDLIRQIAHEALSELEN